MLFSEREIAWKQPADRVFGICRETEPGIKQTKTERLGGSEVAGNAVPTQRDEHVGFPDVARGRSA